MRENEWCRVARHGHAMIRWRSIDASKFNGGRSWSSRPLPRTVASGLLPPARVPELRERDVDRGKSHQTDELSSRFQAMPKTSRLLKMVDRHNVEFLLERQTGTRSIREDHGGKKHSWLSDRGPAAVALAGSRVTAVQSSHHARWATRRAPGSA
nr:hypothetical protein CFP56_70991 [Quercus suber]